MILHVSGYLILLHVSLYNTNYVFYITYHKFNWKKLHGISEFKRVCLFSKMNQ